MDNLYRSGARGKKSMRYLGGDIRLRKSLLDFCLETGRDELLSQWDEHLNGPLTAADITHGSKRKVWWRCAKGHEWQASAGSRTIKDTGCPVCAGKRVCPGENDLASLFPKFASQWHREKNGRPASRAGNAELKPQSLVALLAGSRVAGRGGCAHVERAAAAPSARGGRCWPASTTSRPANRCWQNSGTRN